jgi:hypothetical protein
LTRAGLIEVKSNVARGIKLAPFEATIKNDQVEHSMDELLQQLDSKQITDQERLELLTRLIGRLHALERETRLKLWPVLS